jgi:hypothetical protein
MMNPPFVPSLNAFGDLTWVVGTRQDRACGASQMTFVLVECRYSTRRLNVPVLRDGCQMCRCPFA